MVGAYATLLQYMESRKELEMADRMVARACHDGEHERVCTARILLLSDLIAKATAVGIAMKEDDHAE